MHLFLKELKDKIKPIVSDKMFPVGNHWDDRYGLLDNVGQGTLRLLIAFKLDMHVY
jgi:hypothetical protein